VVGKKKAEKRMAAPKRREWLCPQLFASTMRFLGSVQGAEGRSDGAPEAPAWQWGMDPADPLGLRLAYWAGEC
jgi:hypothetical protein